MFNCSNCPFNSKFDFSVATHEKLDHPINLRRDLFHCYKASIEKRLCPVYDTQLNVDVDNHVRKRHQWESKEFFYEFQDIETIEKQCDSCNFKTYSEFLWYIHYLCKTQTATEVFIKEEVVKPVESSKWLYCDHCVFKTKYKWSLKSHKIRTHEPFEEFPCTQCSYKARLKWDLNRHIKRKHTSYDEKMYLQCDHCLYKTSHKSDLNRHILSKHTNDDKTKWFNCDQCSYKSKLLYHLSRHIGRKHKANEEKIYFQCDHCLYKTSHKSDLKRHILRKHTNVDMIKWLNCAQCSQSKTSYQLCSHIEGKQEEKIYFHCGHCLYKTFRKSDLNIHILRKHTDDDKIKWVNCAQCCYKAKLSRQLSRHIKRNHISNTNQI